MQRAVLILGMHRSGTSAMAGVLDRLGYAFGSNLLPASADNLKGVFEHMEVVNLHEQMLFENKTTWDDPRPIQLTIPPKTFDSIISALHRDFGRRPFWALKDPRLSLFSATLVSALESRDIRTSVVLMVRNPRDVAASLRVRNAITEAEAANLWLKHTLWPLHALGATPPILVFYDRLMDSANEILRIARLLNAPMMERIFEAEGFLSQQLRHHRRAAQPDDEAGLCNAMKAAFSIYKRLLAINADTKPLQWTADFNAMLDGIEVHQAYTSYAGRRMGDIFNFALMFFREKNGLLDRQNSLFTKV